MNIINKIEDVAKMRAKSGDNKHANFKVIIRKIFYKIDKFHDFHDMFNIHTYRVSQN